MINIFTRIKLKYIKKHLKMRNAQRRHWGNYIQIKEKHIIKMSNGQRTRFEQQIINFLSNYYTNTLNVEFIVESEFYQQKTIVITPIVNISLLAYLLPKKYLFKETKKILERFANSQECTLSNIKKHNPIVDHFEIYCADIKADNFFRHKHKFYLLDLEDFYFMMFDKNNNKIHYSELRTEEQKLLIKYQERLRIDKKDPHKTSIKYPEYSYIVAY